MCDTDGFDTKTYDTDKSGCSVSFIVLNGQFDMIVKQIGCLVESLVDELGSQGVSVDIVPIGSLDVGGESVERELDVVFPSNECLHTFNGFVVKVLGTELGTGFVLEIFDVLERERFKGFSHESFAEVLALSVLESDLLNVVRAADR